MVRLTRLLTLGVAARCMVTEATRIAGRQSVARPQSNGLQGIVTWDKYSLFVNGQRIMLYSGEYHPFRLPVQDLHLDIFQKMVAMGFNACSFYIDWALVEGQAGHFTADGIFDMQPFFDAAKKAGIYLIARPGPYINAEVTGGGFPGWLQNIPGYLRTSNASYISATQNYIDKVSPIINQNDILHGGPIILFQFENEYIGGAGYFAQVREQFLKAGVSVPFINNDPFPGGNQAPGKPGGVDIYGHDGYPQGFDCADPYTWLKKNLDGISWWYYAHLSESPNTPYAIMEFQGGAFDPWGGPGFEKCGILTNQEFERVFYKELTSFGVKILNIYMTYGGTNWGNLGHPGGYTSYDYGAAIRENRGVDREKYSAQKLIANMLMASPAYLTALADVVSKNGTYVPSPDLQCTPVRDVGGSSKTVFYHVRHSDSSTLAKTSYRLTVPSSSSGSVIIPQLGGSLTLIGRDAKIHVVDYDVGGYNLFYSSAEIFTWKKYRSYTTLVVYGAQDELHEMAFRTTVAPIVLQGTGIEIQFKTLAYVLQWTNQMTNEPRVVKIDNLYIYIIDRNAAYNYWTVGDVIVQAGYLIRTASIKGGTLALTGDLNATVPLNVIGAPAFSSVTFNGRMITTTKNTKTGATSATLPYTKPYYQLPDLKTVEWKYLDSLPEIKSSYSDAAWTVANQRRTFNTHRIPLLTPTVLFSSVYGYYYGSVIYRGHFTATGSERTLNLWTVGGNGYGMSAWIGDQFIGSVLGADYYGNANSSFALPRLMAGSQQVITVVVDNMGLNENWNIPDDLMKEPRGIVDFSINGHAKSDVTWKLTGNLGGENYVDKTRGPLNEGALFAERQGYNLPNPPTETWPSVAGGPMTGIAAPGIGFYVTKFTLNMPAGYDIPLSFDFDNSTVLPSGVLAPAYRCQLWVNGYNFGKYVNNIGPQTSFPVPEGILNYHGENTVAVSLWALGRGGAKLSGLTLKADAEVMGGVGSIRNSPMPPYVKRPGAY